MVSWSPLISSFLRAPTLSNPIFVLADFFIPSLLDSIFFLSFIFIGWTYVIASGGKILGESL